MIGKRSIVAILAIAFALAIPLASFATPGAETTPVSKDHLDITWVYPYQTPYPEAGTKIQKYIEQKFNVTLHLFPFDTWTDEQKLTTYIAAGNYPDLFVRWGWQSYYDNGVIGTVDEKMVRQYWPSAAKAIDGVNGRQGWETFKSYADGKQIWIPGVSLLGDAPWVTFLRQDWMDKVGMSKLPTTVDELYALGKAFNTKDPDGNGRQDTYLYGGMHDLWCWNYVWAQTNGAYGYVPNQWIKENGKIVNTYVSDRYKAVLKVYAKWYKEGIIDPEFGTDKYATFTAKLLDGRLGADFNMYNSITDPNLPSNQLMKKDPNAKFVPLIKLTGPSGDYGSWSYGPLVWATAFGAKTSDAKKIRILQILEATDSDMTLYKYVHWGDLNTDYTINADGQAVVNPNVKQMDIGSNIFASIDNQTVDKNILLSGKKAVDATYGAIKATKILRNQIDNAKAEWIAQNDKSADFASWFSIPYAFEVNAITGKIDIDKEWASYVASWKKAAGQKVLDAVQTMPLF